MSKSSSEGYVALSLQRLASPRHVKISNHTMIVPSQLPPKKLPYTTEYAEQIAVEEEKESEDMLLSRFADETDLPDWYFIWFLRFNSFCFYHCVYKSQAVCFEGSYVGFDLCHRF